MLTRHLTNNLLKKMEQSTVVYLNGPRQCGKSTLVQSLQGTLDADYITFDHYADLMKAQFDPLGFLQNSPRNLILDEAQLAPEIFRPLKAFVDRQQTIKSRKKILLTGSVNVMNLPTLSDALVGRVSLATLYPLSTSEGFSLPKPDVRLLFTGIASLQLQKQISWQDAIAAATYPQLVANPAIDSYDWFEGYITTLLQRDIRQLADIQKLGEIPKIMGLLSARVGSLVNDTNIAVEAALSLTSYRRYRSLLEAVFLIHFLPAWHINASKRLLKAPKVYFLDTALLLHFLRQPLRTLDVSHPVFGHVIENYVFTELLKNTQEDKIKLFHYRDTNQIEVDFVLENEEGEVVAIEVKGRANLSNRDLKNLKSFRQTCGKKFKKGYILHLGSDFYPLGEDFFALPLSFFWP